MVTAHTVYILAFLPRQPPHKGLEPFPMTNTFQAQSFSKRDPSGDRDHGLFIFVAQTLPEATPTAPRAIVYTWPTINIY